jgi:hypothetical protein
MWPFKKKQKPEIVKETVAEKPKKKIEFHPETVELGKTTLMYVFEGEREFYSTKYGEFQQSFDHGKEGFVVNDSFREKSDAKVWEPFIKSSISRAQYALSNYDGVGTYTIVDDEKNPMQSMMGKIVSIKIITTESYKEKVQIARSVDDV